MPQRITVFDDDPAILALFEDVLTDAGYTVIPHHDPQMLVSEIAAEAPDLIILDWRYGGHATGGDMLARLKSYTPTATIPVIVCTADPQTLEACAAQWGALGVATLPKPFELTALDAMLSAYLDPA